MSLSSQDCLFCKIVKKEIPSNEVAQNELAYAFNDINPVANTHVLVIPKQHIDNLHSLQTDHKEALMAIVTLIQEVAEKKGVADSGYRVVVNIGPDALNSVGHLHFHVIGGRRLSWPPG
jgi:histidine triad (HIT) family protein